MAKKKDNPEIIGEPTETVQTYHTHIPIGVVEDQAVVPASPYPLTGVARTIQTFHDRGNPHYKILTIWLDEGVVTHVEAAGPYASFELMDKLAPMNNASFDRLRANWKLVTEDGEIFSI